MTTKLFQDLKIGDKFKLNDGGFIIYEKNGANSFTEYSHGLSILENPKQKELSENSLFNIVYPVSEV